MGDEITRYLRRYYDYGREAARMLIDAEDEMLAFSYQNGKLEKIRRNHHINGSGRLETLAMAAGMLRDLRSLRAPLRYLMVINKGFIPLPPYLRNIPPEEIRETGQETKP